MMRRKQFLGELAQLTAEFRRVIEAEVDGLPTDAESVRCRTDQAKGDYAFFARTYFPHYCPGAPSLVHGWLFAELPKRVDDVRGRKVALAAPRGEAKSTLVTLVFVLWCIATRRKHFIPIIMDSYDQAVTMLEAIKAELEVNPRLSGDYPQITGEGRIWREGVIITANDVKVQAFGATKRMRGLRHGPHRPDLVILDDIENDENVRSPTQRDKVERWLSRTVLKLGPADDSMDVIYVGTLLHYDSVLARTLKNPLWESRSFKALIEWPARMDLWERWEEVLRNQGEAAATAYYHERQPVMDEGAVVSWSARPLLTLMIVRARDGHSSFDTELQNDPISSEDATFGSVQFWVQVQPDWLYFGAVDPSLGKAGQGRDPSAILVGGYARRTGVLDVVVADIRKRLPDRIIEDIIRYQRQYGCRVWAVESVQFQEFFRTELVKRSAAQSCPVPARGVMPHADKQLRIEALQPHVANGLIRFHSSQTTMLEQLRHFPMADHDDGPDALQMLWMVATTAGAPMAYHRVGRHHNDADTDYRNRYKGF